MVLTVATNLADHLGRPLERPLRLAVVGLGGRGGIYAEAIAAAHPGEAEVVQVAEPRPLHRDRVAGLLGLAADATFTDGTTSPPLIASPTR